MLVMFLKLMVWGLDILWCYYLDYCSFGKENREFVFFVFNVVVWKSNKDKNWEELRFFVEKIDICFLYLCLFNVLCI